MSSWPELNYTADAGTKESLHLLLQLIGKLPLRLHPWVNHGWHAALRITPRGAITRSMPGPKGSFTVELNFHDGTIVVACDSGSRSVLDVAGRTVADVQRDLAQLLTHLGMPAPLHGGPNEMANPVPFAEDDRDREWDPDAARRLHGAFLAADRNFNVFRSLYRGKTSPSHLFWGSFDLAVTRFSGRPAPTHPGGIPHLPDDVTREAYSHEVISAGFWSGGGGFDEAAFYAYAYPSPAGLSDQAVEPGDGFWHRDLGEFILPYAAVRNAADPDAALQAFLASTYEAAARLLDWPEGMVIAPRPVYARPPSAG